LWCVADALNVQVAIATATNPIIIWRILVLCSMAAAQAYAKVTGRLSSGFGARHRVDDRLATSASRAVSSFAGTPASRKLICPTGASARRQLLLPFVSKVLLRIDRAGSDCAPDARTPDVLLIGRAAAGLTSPIAPTVGFAGVSICLIAVARVSSGSLGQGRAGPRPNRFRRTIRPVMLRTAAASIAHRCPVIGARTLTD
jgi:hypothetical protein